MDPDRTDFTEFAPALGRCQPAHIDRCCDWQNPAPDTSEVDAKTRYAQPGDLERHQTPCPAATIIQMAPPQQVYLLAYAEKSDAPRPRSYNASGPPHVRCASSPLPSMPIAASASLQLFQELFKHSAVAFECSAAIESAWPSARLNQASRLVA